MIVGDILEIARRLAAAKVLAEEQGGHAYWLRWIDEEFSWSEPTARNFLNVHALVEEKSANFADLDMPVSRLYLLAAPNTPDETRDAVIERATNGEVLSVADVQRIELRPNFSRASMGTG